MFGGHGGPKNQLKLLQASQLAQTIRGKGELAVVGGPVSRRAVRLRILFRNGPPIDLVPLEVGPQFPVKFYALFYLQPATTAWMPERMGRLRQGWPPNRGVLGNYRRRQRL